ncbi:hypothetical protein SAMN02745194_04262 [Roseomonas rosea]|uniref:Uncharacterized protein n=1 Tax=Muricoccus roseus TaxID=198092 RepID=A0A1M6Q0A6_9PROT|nr:hypothetical protein [Roseomonas rosea]SHK13634.1 hypothetical protein SAMN02745194_04262 [Roseomonas rosea]
MSDDKLPAPLFAHPEPGGRLTLPYAAQLIGLVVPDSTDPTTQLRRHVAERLVQTRSGPGGAKGIWLAWSDVLAAAALRVARAAGAEADAIQAASRALYAWGPDHPASRQSHHPVTHAIFAANDGTEWVLHLNRRVHPQTAARRVDACASSALEPFLPDGISDDGFEVESVLAVRLTPLARRLKALAEADTTATEH